MKQIAVFGCSWSFGMPDLGNDYGHYIYDCWPLRLAKDLPDYRVYNFARGGTGIGYHIALLHEFLESPLYKKETTKIVFQVTQPNRYTYNIDDCLSTPITWNTLENYHVDFGRQPKTFKASHFRTQLLWKDMMPPMSRWEMDTINVNTWKYDDKKQLKFYKSYLRNYADITRDQEFIAQIAYVKNICDFVYAHMPFKCKQVPRPVITKYTRIPVVWDNLGKVEFEKWVGDDGNHFDSEGLEYTKNWIKGNLDV